jgi:23S rRNA (pseudouridine1915-N3)-methyltransferase
MEIQLMCIGKTDRSFWSDAVFEYQKRLKHYVRFSIIYLPEIKIIKKIDKIKVKIQEGKLLLQKLNPNDTVILLDEKGKSLDSKTFSKEIENYMIKGKKKIIFVVGGAYGFSVEVYKTFPNRFALSKMTFSHQMVRLFFCEQLFRAFTIINNHPYHNQ